MNRIGPRTEPCSTPWQTGGLKGAAALKTSLPCNPPPNPNTTQKGEAAVKIKHTSLCLSLQINQLLWTLLDQQAIWRTVILHKTHTTVDIVKHIQKHTHVNTTVDLVKKTYKHTDAHTILLWSHTPREYMSVKNDKLFIHYVLKPCIWCCSLIVSLIH